MTEPPATIRKILWTEVFPWLLLFRSFGLAIRTRKLVFAALALVLTSVGWWGLGTLFSGRTGDPQLTNGIAAYSEQPWSTRMQFPWDQRWQFGTSEHAGQDWSLVQPLLDPWARLADPFRRMFEPELTWTGLAFYLLCGLWAAAVWSYFGGAIARITAHEIARDENPSSAAVFRHVRGKFTAYFSAPLMPLVGVLIFVALLSPLGLLTRLDVGAVVVGAAWPLVLLAGLIMTLFVLGLVFGWPLMWGAVSAEAMDSWDALSRSYAYVFQRPVHYLFYAVVASIVGIAGWLVVAGFASSVIYLGSWGISWSSGAERVAQLEDVAPPALATDHWPAPVQVPTSGTVRTAGALIAFWSGCVKLLALGYIYSYFWTSFTSIYFLLRQSADGTPLDEMHLDEEELPAPEPAVINGDEEEAVPQLKSDATALTNGTDHGAAIAPQEETGPTTP